MTVHRDRWERRILAAEAIIEHALHDLKQPANLIRVLAQEVSIDVRRGRLDIEELPESMSEIERSVDELVIMLGRLRRLFRAPTQADEATIGHVVVEARCDPKIALQTAIEEFRIAWPSIEIVAELDSTLPEVTIDQRSLEQALSEVLDNSAHAISEHGGQIEATSRVDRNQVVLRIVDDGGGTPKALRPRLFDPFVSSRADAAGLGLPIARELLTSAGATIALDTDEGTTRVELRLAVAPSARD